MLGFGTLWEGNELISPYLGGNTQYTYRGYALPRYQSESGNRFSPFIPLEQAGGGGTALGHWDSNDPFFLNPAANRAETMIGFNAPFRKFVSGATWGSLADLGYVVRGVNDSDFHDFFGGRRGRPKIFGPNFPGWIQLHASR